MLEKPAIPDEQIAAALQAGYDLQVVEIEFLPLGADVNTAVYQVVSRSGETYFLKIRRGNFDPLSVLLPRYLSDQGIAQIIPPLLSRNQQPWALLNSETLILYPFVEGRDGYQVELTSRHWVDFGSALRRIHGAQLPQKIFSRLHRETYSAHYRQVVNNFLDQIDGEIFQDVTAFELREFLRSKRSQILDLIRCADQHAQVLPSLAPEWVVCHSDLHAGNILIASDQSLYLVDWDEPLLAPRERDLMFIGGAQGFRGHSLVEEAQLFYQGYGGVKTIPQALAYYRFERVIQDIAAFCDQILNPGGSGEDRQQALKYLKSNFLPNHTIEAAYRAHLACPAHDFAPGS
jgi:spectinomycin phosphotransferase